MSAPVTEELTLRLPADDVELIREAASKRRMTPDELVMDGVRALLRERREETPDLLKPYIEELEAQPRSIWKRALKPGLTAREIRRLSDLLYLSKIRTLDAGERAELDTLLEKVELSAARKAAALWLFGREKRAAGAAR